MADRTLARPDSTSPFASRSRRRSRHLGDTLLACALAAGVAAGTPAGAADPKSTATTPADPLHAWAGEVTPASIAKWTQEHLDRERALIARATADGAPKTVAARFAPFDEASGELQMADSQLSILMNAHASRELRDAAQALEQKVGEEGNALSLDARMYRALAAIDAGGEDAATRHVLDRALLEYRLAGADRDEATRAKLRAELDAITKIGLEFERNINESILRIDALPGELAGLPADFLAAHPAGPDGKVVLTTSQPEYDAVLTFADSVALRERMHLAYTNRAVKENDPLLRDLLRRRRNIARLLGYSGWPEVATADQMIGTPKRLREFLARFDEATAATARGEFDDLLAFARQHDPSIATLNLASRFYWKEKFRREHLDFDSRSMRPYFPYDQVERGILAVTGRFFRVRFDRVRDAPVWDPSVTTWDVVDEDATSPRRGKRIARIYLDMHPREGKDKWFNSGSLVPGVLGRQVPEGRLVCNFPVAKAGDPGLMTFEDVTVFFHELGHLMHGVLGGQVRWATASGVATEWDFVEAPSQMLEEVIADPALLQTFARHYETGAVIPRELVEQMNRATAFGRAISWRLQVRNAAFAFELYESDPDTVDFSALEKAMVRKFDVYAPVEGTHNYASFGHLVGYGPIYYTYLIDKVIALDLYSQFDRGNAAGGDAALRYRHKVLEPGGTRPAEELIADFLGRPWNFDAFGKWLHEAAAPPAASAPAPKARGKNGPVPGP